MSGPRTPAPATVFSFSVTGPPMVGGIRVGNVLVTMTPGKLSTTCLISSAPQLHTLHKESRSIWYQCTQRPHQTHHIYTDGAVLSWLSQGEPGQTGRVGTWGGWLGTPRPDEDQRTPSRVCVCMRACVYMMPLENVSEKQTHLT